ncbi:MAG: GDP-mannose 4,6-dehydratase [Nitrospirota bacterium]
MEKHALITGINGQDGSYLAELLLAKGYKVSGIVRRTAAEYPKDRLSRIGHILPSLNIYSASMENYASIFEVIRQAQPDECYHLAAQSFVGLSFQDEFSTMAININGTHYVLSAIKALCPKCKFYFAATSEMFGNSTDYPQNEDTPFAPRSPYAISKVTGYHLTKHYREAYGLFAASGILFNHESPRRGLEFVTRKITHQAALIKHGLADKIKLGNIDALRDWGHAKDYVKAMWLMLQAEAPDDYVIGTGRCFSVKTFAELAFNEVGLDFNKYVEIDPSFQRPAEVFKLVANPTLAFVKLGWIPEHSLFDLIREMAQYDMEVVGIKN